MNGSWCWTRRLPHSTPSIRRLAEQFRITNGLPAPAPVGGCRRRGVARVDGVGGPAEGHEIRMAVGDRDVRCRLLLRAWASEVDWDGIDTMVVRIRQHLGSVTPPPSDGIHGGDGGDAHRPSRRLRRVRPGSRSDLRQAAPGRRG